MYSEGAGRDWKKSGGILRPFLMALAQKGRRRARKTREETTGEVERLPADGGRPESPAIDQSREIRGRLLGLRRGWRQCTGESGDPSRASREQEARPALVWAQPATHRLPAAPWALRAALAPPEAEAVACWRGGTAAGRGGAAVGAFCMALRGPAVWEAPRGHGGWMGGRGGCPQVAGGRAYRESFPPSPLRPRSLRSGPAGGGECVPAYLPGRLSCWGPGRLCSGAIRLLAALGVAGPSGGEDPASPSALPRAAPPPSSAGIARASILKAPARRAREGAAGKMRPAESGGAGPSWAELKAGRNNEAMS